MIYRVKGDLAERLNTVLGWLRRPELMVFLPAVTLAAFWFGGEETLILTALGAPLIFALAGAFRFDAAQPPPLPDGLTGLALRPQLIAEMGRVLADTSGSGRTTGCLVLRLDDLATLHERHGRAAATEVLASTSERLCSALREGDLVARLDDGGFAVALAPRRRIDLETMVQLAARLQAAVSPPIMLDGARLYATASVGFCLGAQLPAATGAMLLEAAELAADHAMRHGPGAIRAYAADLARRRREQDSFRHVLELALDEGQIRPHFQPQISTDTGQISGFEALARWHHPERGILTPGEFLPALEDAGLGERLGEVMLQATLRALKEWDASALNIPAVGVNFSSGELRNPRLAEKLQWELDRFGLTPERLAVEVLETVVAHTDNDMVVHTIAPLARLGCKIDLDDFGTGHASIGNIRRFSVRRIKIDRSFVTHIDTDRDQQNMVAAILSMAERLGLETLAEGVETAGEHAMLAQLGCHQVQGFWIGRPMPFEAVRPWIEARRQNLTPLPRISRKAV